MKLLLFFTGLAVAVQATTSDEECAVCQLASRWTARLTNSTPRACSADCAQLSDCDFAEALQVHALRPTSAVHGLLRSRLRATKDACAARSKGDELTALLLRQTEVSELLCLECFLAKDMLEFVNQSIFGGWLEEVVTEIMSNFGNVGDLMPILFQALRDSEGALWTTFASDALGCPKTFDDLRAECCTKDVCP